MSRDNNFQAWFSKHPRAMDVLWTLALLVTAVGPALASGGGTSGP